MNFIIHLLLPAIGIAIALSWALNTFIDDIAKKFNKKTIIIKKEMTVHHVYDDPESGECKKRTDHWEDK